MDTLKRGLSNAVDVLYLSDRIGFVTADLVADHLWPDAAHRRKNAEALLRRMARAGWVLPRRSQGAPTIWVSTAAGAGFGAGYLGIELSSGTRFGRIRAGEPWSPPLALSHDLRAARFVVSRRATAYAFGRELQRSALPATKVPDGFADGDWIEVEGGRKDGQDMRDLADALVAVCLGWPESPPALAIPGDLGIRTLPTKGCIVLPPLAVRDSRGYRLDHRARLRSALGRARDAVLAEYQRYEHEDAPPRWQIAIDCWMESDAGAFVEGDPIEV